MLLEESAEVALVRFDERRCLHEKVSDDVTEEPCVSHGNVSTGCLQSFTNHKALDFMFDQIKAIALRGEAEQDATAPDAMTRMTRMTRDATNEDANDEMGDVADDETNEGDATS